MKVEELTVQKYRAFRIVFSSQRKPIVIARSKDAAGKSWWTSIPEGRLKEAAAIGLLIEEYLKKKEQ